VAGPIKDPLDPLDPEDPGLDPNFIDLTNLDRILIKVQKMNLDLDLSRVNPDLIHSHT